MEVLFGGQFPTLTWVAVQPRYLIHLKAMFSLCSTTSKFMMVGGHNGTAGNRRLRENDRVRDRNFISRFQSSRLRKSGGGQALYRREKLRGLFQFLLGVIFAALTVKAIVNL